MSQAKPLAEAREDRKELIANLKGLGQLSGPLGRATMLRAAARIDADGKFVAEIDRQDRLIDDLERRVSALSASPAPETAALREALRAAIAVAEEARAEWDAAPQGMKAGKLLIALAGGLKGYRADIDRIHAALHTGGEGKGETDQTVTRHALEIMRLRAALQQVTVYIVEGSEQYVHLKIGEWDTEIEADEAGAILAFDAAQRAALHTPSPTPPSGSRRRGLADDAEGGDARHADGRAGG